jgi:hypothetical protein
MFFLVYFIVSFLFFWCRGRTQSSVFSTNMLTRGYENENQAIAIVQGGTTETPHTIVCMITWCDIRISGYDAPEKLGGDERLRATSK